MEGSDAGLHQNLTRLDITAANAPAEMQWQSTQLQQAPPQGFGNHQPATVAPHQVQTHPVSMPEQPVTPRKNKRQAWYGGPVTPASNNQTGGFGTHRPSPEDSGSSDGVLDVSHDDLWRRLAVNPECCLYAMIVFGFRLEFRDELFSIEPGAAKRAQLVIGVDADSNDTESVPGLHLVRCGWRDGLLSAFELRSPQARSNGRCSVGSRN